MAIQNANTSIQYLRKHAALVKNNPGLVWCLENGIDKISDALLEIKRIFDECHQQLGYLNEMITKLNSLSTAKDKEIIRLRKDMKIQHDLWLNRENLGTEWRNRITEYNNEYKLLIGELQEKLEQCIKKKPTECEDKCTMTGILSNVKCKLSTRKYYYANTQI